MNNNDEIYPNSSMPPGQGAHEIVPPERRGSYWSMAEAGLVNVDLPRENGTVETIVAAHLPYVIQERMEGHLNYAPGKAAGAFAHFTGAMKGSGLMDDKCIARMEKLNVAFAASGNQAKFYEENVKPFLSSLTPGQR